MANALKFIAVTNFVCHLFQIDWNEFMNYMLIENTTLSSMKQEHFEYLKIDKLDPKPRDEENAHSKNITCMIIIDP